LAGISFSEWDAVADLIEAALGREPRERLEFLRAACVDDEARAAQAERLLAVAEQAAAFLEEPAAVGLADLLREAVTGPGGPMAVGKGPPRGDAPPERIGPYRVVREIGRGGMGVVYLAERADAEYRRRVAIKIVRAGFGARELEDRFRHERQILASLDHPHIARLYDGGVTEDGRPYLVMELVEGEPIDRYCDERALDIDARLALFDQACAAVQYAHRRLIVHRDLKPANILVSAAGVKLLDFGIAKLLDRESADASTRTAGLGIMTPEYAAPEQIRGEPVTTSTDVYALGAVLYELLAGRRPHAIRRGSIEEMARVLTQDVVPPSSAASRPLGQDDEPARMPDSDASPAASAAATRATTPDRLRRRLKGDLDAIVLTALRTEPEKRYASAEALREDVRRHRSGFPVSARPVTPAYRLGRFMRRNRVAAAAGLVAFASLAVGFAGTVWQARKAASERDAALAEADKATRMYNLMADVFQLAAPAQARGRDVPLREVLDTGRVWISRELAEQPELRADMDIVLGEVYYSLGLYEHALELYRDAVGARTGFFGETYESVATAWLMVGKAHEGLGNPDSAEIAARRGFEILERLPSFEGRDFTITHALVRLGESLRRNGRLAEAEDTIRYALDLLSPTTEDARWRRTVLLNLLGHVRRARGDAAGAERLHREVLEERRVMRGERDPEVANAYKNLAAAIADQGRYDEAETLFRRGLEIRRGTQGRDHADYATDLAAFAEVLRAKSAPVEALLAFQQALPVLRRVLPPDHPLVLDALLGLSETLIDLQRADEAARYLREATVAADSLAMRFGAVQGDFATFRQRLEHLRARVRDTTGQPGRDPTG
jgi:serine/threonine-protein kinase